MTTWPNTSEVTRLLGSTSIEINTTDNVTPIVTLSNTMVTANTYSYPTIAIDAQGRITSASSNTPVLTVSGTALDISSTGGQNPVLDLISTAVTPGAYNFASLTVDAKGRLTAASTGTPVTSVAAGTGLTGGTITSTGTIALANTAVTVGTYNFASLTVDQQGRLTAASTGTPVTSVTLSGSTGLTIGGTNPITSTGTISLTLGSELQALSGLSTTGLVTRTAANTYTQRTITGTASNITISNGSGVAGNPTIDLATAGTAQTTAPSNITTDAYGRVTNITPRGMAFLTSGSGTWVPPTGVTSIKVTVVGGGGGAGANNAGGGGAGGTAIAYFSILPNLSYTVGATSPSGGAGNPSTFSSSTTLMTANGGLASSSSTAGVGAAGGTATLGAGIANGLAISGGGGGMSNSIAGVGIGGAGGNSSLGGGGAGGQTSRNAPNNTGGGGGSGAGGSGNSTGGSGVIIIEY